jgi:hypothetical protein
LSTIYPCLPSQLLIISPTNGLSGVSPVVFSDIFAPAGMCSCKSLCFDKLLAIASLCSNCSMGVLAEFVIFCVDEQADNDNRNIAAIKMKCVLALKTIF